jgi:hypothetical protein
MLHEFAVEPDVLSNWGSFRYFADQFGVQHGRMISRFPKKWKRMVYNACSRCGEIERKRIEEGLENISSKLLRTNRYYDADIPWLSNAEAQNLVKPFHAIIAVSNPREVPEVLIAENITGATVLWNVKRETCVFRNAIEMAQCVKPLFQACSEVLFIDPHFNPSKPEYLNTFQQFFLAMDGNARIRRIEYHLKESDERPSREYFEEKCQRNLPDLFPRGVEVIFIRWREMEGGETLHPRYILTDIGGVRIEHGLDEGEEGETTDISLLDLSLYSQRWRDFQQETSPYEYVDEVKIVGNMLAR